MRRYAGSEAGRTGGICGVGAGSRDRTALRHPDWGAKAIFDRRLGIARAQEPWAAYGCAGSGCQDVDGVWMGFPLLRTFLNPVGVTSIRLGSEDIYRSLHGYRSSVKARTWKGKTARSGHSRLRPSEPLKGVLANSVWIRMRKSDGTRVLSRDLRFVRVDENTT